MQLDNVNADFDRAIPSKLCIGYRNSGHNEEDLFNGELSFGIDTDVIVLQLLTSVYALESFCATAHTGKLMTNSEKQSHPTVPPST